MCVDFTNLNRACPKDSYPLLNIDKLVDAATGYEYMCFMDTYSGYNQIRIHLEEEEKTTFMTDGLSYYYKVMPFRLKNIGVIYTRDLWTKYLQIRSIEMWKFTSMTW